MHKFIASFSTHHGGNVDCKLLAEGSCLCLLLKHGGHQWSCFSPATENKTQGHPKTITGDSTQLKEMFVSCSTKLNPTLKRDLAMPGGGQEVCQ